MNRREKILGAAVGFLILGFAAHQWAIGPALAWYRSVREEAADNQAKVDEAQMLEENRGRIVADWRARHKAGLLEDENGARFGAQQAVNAAAKSAGFTVESLGGGQRVPAAAGQSYDTLRLSLAGQGSLAQTQGFLAGLRQAAVPLCVERCELAARDGRKDQMDLALTLSLRIASKSAREKMAVPPKTAPWQPPVRPSALDGEILKAKPFLADRRGDAPPPKAVEASPEPPPPPPPPPGSDWALVGLVLRDGGGEAFLVRASDGREVVAHAGDQVADGLVKAVDAAGLRMIYGEEERVIQPGSTLAGTPAASPARSFVPTSSSAGSPRSFRPSRDTAAPAVPTPPPATASDADREAILKRLREQRNRTSP